MRTLWIIGAFVAVAGLLGAELSIPDDFGAWSDSSKMVPNAGAVGAARRQIDARAAELAKLHADLADSTNRAQALRKHLVTESSPLLLGARRAIDEEKAIANKINGRIRQLVVSRNTAVRDAAGMAVLTVVTLLVTGLIGAWISLSKALATAPPTSRLGGAALGIVIGVVLFVANTIQELGTSVFVEKKDAFGFASWAVSPRSWTCVRVMALGLCLVFASVLATAWDAAAPERMPEPDVRHEDGAFGVTGYLTAWRWWILLGASASLFVAVSEVLAIAYGRDSFNLWYLLTPTVGLIATAAPMARAALRVQKLRDACRKARWLGSTRSPSVPAPDDPTDAFWEFPFKVPAFVLLAASAAWLALEKTGVAGTILRSLNGSP